MLTAVSIVALDALRNALVGLVAELCEILPNGTEGRRYFCVLNRDGFARFSDVSTPFNGLLRLTSGCDYYEQNVSINAVNVTLRVGGTAVNPQDIELPPAVPSSFKLPPVNIRDWRGAFCIPEVPFDLSYGQRNTIWTPAFGCLPDREQGQTIDYFLSQGYKRFPYNCAGLPYHYDYPELADDPARVRRDLKRLIRAGCEPVVCSTDDQNGGSLVPWQSFIANADLIRIWFPMWEMNGPLGIADYNGDGTFSGRIVDCIRNTQRVARPDSYGMLHFTAGHGAIGEPERTAWAFCKTLGIAGLMSQDDGFNRDPINGDPDGVAAGLVDTAQRLATLDIVNVGFEQCTLAVYEKRPGWNRAKQKAYGRCIIDHAPGIAGYCDGAGY